ILKQLVEAADPESPPKPCDYFDKIGGASTGGSLNAIMLSWLRMTANECLTYMRSRLSNKSSNNTLSAVALRVSPNVMAPGDML
ncbi:hypothetical protein V2W45_1247750, partial [Cenococcum geophilum]